MKRITRILVMAALACVALASCEKEGPSRFTGNWSFKTSGTVVLHQVDTTTKAGDSLGLQTVRLEAESGQMDIVTKDKDSGSMIITMNALFGDAVLIEAVAEGRKITITPFKRTVHLELDKLTAIQADVTVSGEGERYDDMIVFRLVYEGNCKHLGKEYELQDSDVKCIAKLNDF